MIPVLVAFLSSAFWGGSDFLGGIAARGSTVLRATTWAYTGATAATGIIVLAIPGTWSGAVLGWGAVAAVASVSGFLAFYAAMASAPMGPIGAIAGAMQAIVPVIFAVLWRAEPVAAFAWIGIGGAVVGSALIGLAEGSAGGRATLRPILLAVLAGFFFGAAVVALGAAPANAGMLAPAVEVVGALVLVLLLALAVRRSGRIDRVLTAAGLTSGERRPPKRVDAIAVVSGVVLAGANVLMILALQSGALAAVGVVVSLYPVTTAVLARVFLKERLTVLHVVGIAGALAGCALLAAV